ncbi:hypothetical protein [Bradyrhizobium sp. CCGB12]|uniref:ATP-dependent DNA ligase n=1 Tax=Bradyrhizobium sp. CCGB12 TaxID=2949632 RepID=UPI0035C0E4EB
MPSSLNLGWRPLKDSAPSGAQWIHGIKYDGYRVQVHVDRGATKIFTRNGHDWTPPLFAHRRLLQVAQPDDVQRRGCRGS